jgi:hypothetical protein
MYPNYFLDEIMDASSCESASAGNRIIWPQEPWLRGKNFFWYLHEVHDFPFRKLKWPTKVSLTSSERKCLTLLCGEVDFDEMPYPSKEVLEAY